MQKGKGKVTVGERFRSGGGMAGARRARAGQGKSRTRPWAHSGERVLPFGAARDFADFARGGLQATHYPCFRPPACSPTHRQSSDTCLQGSHFHYISMNKGRSIPKHKIAYKHRDHQEVHETQGTIAWA